MNWSQELGWVLIHSLWQDALIGLILCFLLRLLAHATSHLRHSVVFIALIFCPVAALLTWISLEQGNFSFLQSIANISSASVHEPSSVLAGPASTYHSVVLSDTSVLRPSIEPILPWIDVVWIIGVFLLSLRLALGWHFLRKLSGFHMPVLDVETRARFQMLLHRMHIAVSVRLVQSVLVEVPMVIGWWRPLILLPGSTAMGLSPEEVEAVLAHELVHIARHDFLLNLLQTVVETLFYYHPAVWWIGRKLREERENCCDDQALSVIDRHIYVQALARLEESRSTGASLPMAATGPNLLLRIRRLAGIKPKIGSVLPGGVLLMVMVMGIASLLPAQIVTSSMISTPASHEGIAALVNGHPILEKAVDKGMGESQSLVKLTGDDLKQKIALMRKDVLKELIDRELILENFSAMGGKISQGFLDADIQIIIQGAPYNGDKAAFDKTLTARGISLAQFRQDVADAETVFGMRESHAQSVAYQFYQEHPDQFPMDERCNLTVLLIGHDVNVNVANDPVYALANQIDRDAKAGTSFDFLQTKYLKPQEANMFTAWFTSDQTEFYFSTSPEKLKSFFSFDSLHIDLRPLSLYSLTAEEWSAIQKLQPGQVSDVFQSPDKPWYFIVKMNERRPARIALTEETKEQKKNLLQAIQDTSMKTWLKDLREPAHIEIF